MPSDSRLVPRRGICLHIKLISYCADERTGFTEELCAGILQRMYRRVVGTWSRDRALRRFAAAALFAITSCLCSTASAHVVFTDLQPNMGFLAGSVVSIAWVDSITHQTVAYHLEFIPSDGATAVPIADLPPTQHSYSWQVPATPCSVCSLHIIQDNVESDSDYSDTVPIRIVTDPSDVIPAAGGSAGSGGSTGGAPSSTAGSDAGGLASGGAAMASGGTASVSAGAGTGGLVNGGTPSTAIPNSNGGGATSATPSPAIAAPDCSFSPVAGVQPTSVPKPLGWLLVALACVWRRRQAQRHRSSQVPA
jgi:hypothetical protein